MTALIWSHYSHFLAAVNERKDATVDDSPQSMTHHGDGERHGESRPLNLHPCLAYKFRKSHGENCRPLA